MIIGNKTHCVQHIHGRNNTYCAPCLLSMPAVLFFSSTSHGDFMLYHTFLYSKKTISLNIQANMLEIHLLCFLFLCAFVSFSDLFKMLFSLKFCVSMFWMFVDHEANVLQICKLTSIFKLIGIFRFCYTKTIFDMPH